MKKLLLILSLLYGCATANKLSELKFDCSKKNEIGRISDSLMIRGGYKLELLNRRIKENQDSIIVQYLLKDSLSTGGGAEIRISKKDCKIMLMIRYQ